MPKADNGIKKQRYQVIPRTLIFLFGSQNNVLLIKGSQQKQLWPGLYNGIGGHVEAGEDILEAAERELYEEARVKDIKLNFCGQIMVDISQSTGVAVFIFKGYYDGVKFVSSTEGELAWVDLEKLDEKLLVEDLSSLIPLVANHQQGESIIFGKYTYGQDGDLIIAMR